jgi:hypothetical protein
MDYMAWKTRDRTLAAYEHVQRREAFLGTLTSIHKEMRRRSKSFRLRRLHCLLGQFRVFPLRWSMTTSACSRETTVTTDEALQELRLEIGVDWPKCKPIPNHLIMRFCDDRVWENVGIHQRCTFA